MLNIKKQVIAVIVLTIVLIPSAVSLCSYAMPAGEIGEECEQYIWFDYDDGIVRDGSVGDVPGLIGDEYDGSYSGAYSDNYNNYNNNADNAEDPNTSPDMAQNGYGTADGAVAGVTDTDNSMESFWGVVLALVVGAAAILIAVFAIPGTRNERSSGGR